MADARRLFGSRAIVTGASNGIGEAIVRTFVKQGADVFAVDRPDSGIETHFNALRQVTPYATSITDESSIAELLALANEALKGLDIVVSNMAIQPGIPIGRGDGDNKGDGTESQQFLDRKIQHYAAIARAALPHLEKSPAGRIINMACIRSAFSRTAETAYARSTSALAELTNTLAAEAGPYGATVNYVQPGAVMTPASRRVFAEDKELRDYCIENSAAKRLGEPVDIAKVVLFLASDDAVFVSGTGIVVDGGSL